MCQHLSFLLSNTKHLKTLSLNGQPLSVNSCKTLTAALSENENWVENVGLASCEMTDDCASVLGAYFYKKQVGSLEIGGNKFTFKAMTRLMEDLTMSAESGRLL